MPAAHTDWQRYTGPAHGVGWSRINPQTGKKQIVYTQSRTPPGSSDHPIQEHHASNVSPHRVDPGGFGDAHRAVAALRLIHRLVANPGRFDSRSLLTVMRLLQHLPAGKIRAIRRHIVYNPSFEGHSDGLRERAHIATRMP